MKLCAKIDGLLTTGGIAGLVCATAAASSNLKVVVLEARKRWGGRLLSFQGLDYGASWCWPPHEAKAAVLAKELGIKMLRQRLSGECLESFNGSVSRVGRQGDRMAPCGHGASKFLGGYSLITNRLAARLERAGAELCLDSRVTSVKAHRNGVCVTFSKAEDEEAVVWAKRAVMAIPPAVLAATVTFVPSLAPDKRLRMADTATWCGDWCKVGVVFHTAFWRTKGLSGVVATDGPVSIWLEGAGGEEEGESTSGLIGLGFGKVACTRVAEFGGKTLEGGDSAKLRAFAIKQLGAAFGAVVEEQLISCHAKVWATDPLTFAGGTSRAYGHELLRKPTSWGVFFAGSETESYHGHVEGAIVSGKRAFREVTGSLLAT